MFHSIQKGFTIVELMIVITIIGILSTIAIPAYSDYSIRAKVAEMINMGAFAKAKVAEFRLTNNRWPADASEAGVGPTQTDFVSSLAINGSGVITINGDSAALGAAITVLLVPEAKSGVVDWSCNSVGNPAHVPKSCR